MSYIHTGAMYRCVYRYTYTRYIPMYIPIYTELRREDVLCIMEENVEDRSPGGDPLWGTVDYKFERVKISIDRLHAIDSAITSHH